MEDRKAGSKIRVTTEKDDRNVATGIESLEQARRVRAVLQLRTPVVKRLLC